MNLDRHPNFCGHEHWGSVPSIGTVQEGYRADVIAGALPRRRTTLVDLVADPYLYGNMLAAGDTSREALARRGADDLWTLALEDFPEAWSLLFGWLVNHEPTGAYRCVRRGIRRLYGVTLEEAGWEELRRANERVERNYSGLFGWYAEVMEETHFSGLVRPVHPEYFFRCDDEQSARREREITLPILRIDPFLDMWTEASVRRDALSELIGVEPGDAPTWRRFLLALFDRCRVYGNVGIKQLQAYRRILDFPNPGDREVRFRGELSPGEVKRFQDWVVNECCKLADDAGWSHQLHVGTHNLPDSSPVRLGDLARRYPDMNVVLIHCWPYIDESAYLAKTLANVYLDTCWQPVLNPDFLVSALRAWIGYVPSDRILCSHDSTSVEMAVGSAAYTREILGKVLEEKAESLDLNDRQTDELARRFLADNAERLYRPG
jgi:hypothetical protein